MIFCIKNFHKNKNSSLTAKSVRHFGDYKVYLINVYKDSIDRTDLDDSLFDGIFDFKAKYDHGPGFGNPANGCYFTEGINHAFNCFRESDEKVVVLDEDHFFTNGATIKELEENEYDYAWAHWASPDPHPLDVNAAIVSFRPKKFEGTGLFPLPERIQFVETLLRTELLQRIPSNLLVYKMVNRNYEVHNGGAKYYGDGIFTNDYSVVESHMRNAGIII
jgi:hypothetical protein